MRVSSNVLTMDDGTPVTMVSSPNASGTVKPEYLVLHFTAGRSASSSVKWLTDPASKASAHLVIGRDGSIAQLVPFDRVAWHAGESEWLGRKGLNQISIGIELDNAGKLERQGGSWRAWFGDVYPDPDVLVAQHPHGGAEAGWHIYTSTQLDVAFDTALAIVRHFGLRDVLGHEDVAPGRKVDPGPAFPLRSFRARLLGRENDARPIYRAGSKLNVRAGPGIDHALITGSPLAVGAAIEAIDRPGLWWRVRFTDGSDGEREGWVNSRFLREAA